MSDSLFLRSTHCAVSFDFYACKGVECTFAQDIDLTIAEDLLCSMVSSSVSLHLLCTSGTYALDILERPEHRVHLVITQIVAWHIQIHIVIRK